MSAVHYDQYNACKRIVIRVGRLPGVQAPSVNCRLAADSLSSGILSTIVRGIIDCSRTHLYIYTYVAGCEEKAIEYASNRMRLAIHGYY
jgi:hypothetical protein